MHVHIRPFVNAIIINHLLMPISFYNSSIIILKIMYVLEILQKIQNGVNMYQKKNAKMENIIPEMMKILKVLD